MGSYSITCNLSNLAIDSNNEVFCIGFKKGDYKPDLYLLMNHINFYSEVNEVKFSYGKYDDYGLFLLENDIDKDKYIIYPFLKEVVDSITKIENTKDVLKVLDFMYVNRKPLIEVGTLLGTQYFSFREYEYNMKLSKIRSEILRKKIENEIRECMWDYLVDNGLIDIKDDEPVVTFRKNKVISRYNDTYKTFNLEDLVNELI